MNAQRRKSSVAWLSVISNSTLVLFKLIVGLAIGSISVISEAMHSGIDLAAAIIALLAVRTSGKPADQEHPYGHGKIENISGFFEALLIAAAAIWIIIEAAQRLKHPGLEMDKIGWGILVMFISALANFFVSQRLTKIAKETDSIALQADGCHLRTDVITSMGVMISLLLIMLLRFTFRVKFYWLDPASAIVVACFIFKTAYDLTRQSLRDLMDASLPIEEEAWIREYISRLRPSICGFHRLRTRKAGTERFVELHLIVEAHMLVTEAHDISEVLTSAIENRLPHTTVTVHIEPCDGKCPEICIQGCFLSEGERQTQQRLCK